MAVRFRTRAPTDGERLAQEVYLRLHPVMALLGVLFAVVVLGQGMARDGFRDLLTGLSWAIWAVFVLEYLLRLVIAPSTAEFLRRTWWQLIFLVLPALSLVRAMLFLRLARPTRVLLASVRGSRSARGKLSGRVGWLSATTAIVVFSAANLLYEFADYRPYRSALHAAAMAAISGESMANRSGMAQALDVVLSLYSVVFFASLAGMLGAFFLERSGEQRDVLNGRPPCC